MTKEYKQKKLLALASMVIAGMHNQRNLGVLGDFNTWGPFSDGSTFSTGSVLSVGVGITNGKRFEFS